MVANFLRKLFASPAAQPPEIAEALVELKRLAQERPTLAAPASLLADVLPVLYQEPITESQFALAPDLAATKLASGIPLLRGEKIEIDLVAFRRRWLSICAAAEPHRPGCTALADSLRRGALDARLLVQEALAGRPEGIHSHADTLGLDASLTATVLRLVLLPTLAHLAAGLEPLRQDSRWERGYCPTCGSWPLLGELRGMEQTRFLRCGLCATGWEFPRLRCPFCDNTDHRQLGYLQAEGEEMRYRAATCDTCHGYVKMLSVLAALMLPRLLVADVATLHLDLVAAERGYGS